MYLTLVAHIIHSVSRQNVYIEYYSTYLNVSSIIVKSTNFPKSGTTNDVGGIISANNKKNTVSDSKMDMLNETCN